MFIPKNLGLVAPRHPRRLPQDAMRGPVLPPIGRSMGAPAPGHGVALGHLPKCHDQPRGGAVDRGFFAGVRERLLPRKASPKPGWSMPPPIPLREVISSKPSLAYMRYADAVERRIRAKSLSHLSACLVDSELMGKGSSKDCYCVDDNTVLLVLERSGMPLKTELMTLQVLKSAGFPVVRVWEAGMIPSRYHNGDGSVSKNAAMTQERLDGFVNFERCTAESRRSLLKSSRLNQNTLNSLLSIRHLIHKEGVCVGDLQGGLRKDGAFVLADITNVSRLSHLTAHQKKALRNLDRMIHEVAAQLNGATKVSS